MSEKQTAIETLFEAYKQARHDGVGIGAMLILEDAQAELARLQAIEAENIKLTARLERARLAMEEYQEYRSANTLNFQLEKADS